MIILSINQRITPNFKDIFVHGDEFRVLDNEQRRVLMKYIDINDSEVSESGYNDAQSSRKQSSCMSEGSSDLSNLID